MNKKCILLFEIIYAIVLSVIFLMLFKNPFLYLAGNDKGISVSFIAFWNMILSPVWIFTIYIFESEMELFRMTMHRNGSRKKWWTYVAAEISTNILIIYGIIIMIFMVFSDYDHMKKSSNDSLRIIAENSDYRVMVLIIFQSLFFFTGWMIVRMILQNAVIAMIIILVIEDISVIYISAVFWPFTWGVFGLSDYMRKNGFSVPGAIFAETVTFLLSFVFAARHLTKNN